MSHFTQHNNTKTGLSSIVFGNNNNLNHLYPSTSFLNHPTDHSGGSGSGGSGGSSSAAGGSSLEGVVEYAAESGTGGGPHIVAMDQRHTQHHEAYYLFFVGSLGMALNLVIVIIIFIRRPLRRMTSAFLIHASFLNFVKAAFCLPFGLNLLSDADETKGNQPPDCVVQGSSFIVIITTSAFNMVAMVCTEAYTFGEVNVGGNSHGTACCIVFGVLVVYITSVILHLGPTLIGGAIVYNPDIGNCAFKLGSVSGYVANFMCIIIITFAIVAVAHFLIKFYKEIQLNRPNRVSMLVRHSISIADDDERHKNSSAVHQMTQDAIHRAKVFVITAVAFVLCWYPLFILIIMDMHFSVSPKVYQAFSFIAWSHPLVEPIILIFFDRNVNILSRFMYCNIDQFTAPQIAYLLSQSQNRQQNRQQQQQEEHLEDLTDSTQPVEALNSHNISMEIEDAFRNVASAMETGSGANTLSKPPLCRHCSSPSSASYNIVASSASPQHFSQTGSNSGNGDTPVTSSTNDLRGFRNMQPLAHSQTAADAMEMNYTSLRRGDYDPVCMNDPEGTSAKQGNIQC